MTTPNYKLLGDAYAIIGGIPENQFNLNTILCSSAGFAPAEPDCGTIGCAFGWLALHPDFKPLMNMSVGRFRLWNINGQEFSWYSDAAAELFGITEREAIDLFGSTGDGKYDERILGEIPDPDVSDKQLWLKRVRAFLDEKGIASC